MAEPGPGSASPWPLLILSGLSFVCLVAVTLVVQVPQIEAKLTARAQRRVDRQNLDFARVRADGRDLHVSGSAPSEGARRAAIHIIASTTGGRTVVDRLRIEREPAREVVAVARPRRGAPVEFAVTATVCQEQLNRTVAENPLRFRAGSATLWTTSVPIIDKIAAVVGRCPEVSFEIQAHTDDVGDDKANLELSQARAEAVVYRLVEFGVSQQRLTATGFGESLPIAPNTTKEGRAQNRRIGFVVRAEE